MWGDDKTATLQITSSVTSTGNLTDGSGNTWAFTTDGSLTSSNSYIQAGTNSKKVSYIKLTTSAFSTKKITKVQVWGTSKANTNVSAKVIIGSTTIGTSSVYKSQTASSGGTEFSVNNTNNVSGDLTIEISRASSANGAIYFNKAIVTYTDTHTLTYSATNGSIAGVDAGSNAVVSGGAVAEAATVTLTATPADGYEFSSWEVSGTGSSLSSTSTNPTTFTMGTANATVTANFVAVSSIATPTISPVSGAVEKGQEITMSCETDGAAIYYTTDGSTPTSSSIEYSALNKPTISSATTIKAIAIKDATSSAVASATYTIKKVATPTFSLDEGEVVYGAEVEISCETEGATIHYTTDESAPTSSSPTYSGAISITDYMVIQAIAIKDNWDNSNVANATYLLKNPDAPTFSPAAGAVAEGSTVTISSDEGTTIYYTTNGDTPTSSSTVYSTGLVINENQTIKAIAVDGAGNSSDVASAAYTTYKANISLSGGQTLTFNDFSGIGTYASPKSADFPASDDNSYRMTGAQFGYYSDRLQMQKSNGVLTSGTISTPNGFTLSVTSAQNPPTVKFGDVLTAASSTSDGTSYYSCASTSTTFTLIASTSGATQVTAISITANKATNTITATTARSIDRTNSESSITLDATSTSGSVTYAVKSSTIESEDYSFNTSTGVLTVTGTYSGTIVITASSAATSSYLAAEDLDITVNVIGTKTDPTIVVSDDNVTYGNDYVLDTSGFASGTVSLVSGNESFATVDGLTITPHAVGTVTITVNTDASAMYNEGSATFDLTIVAPEAKTVAVKGSTISTATLDFTDNTEWSIPTSKTVAANDYSNGTYTITLTGTTGNGYNYNSTNEYVLLGQNGASITFPEFDKFVTQIDVVGSSNASTAVKQNIFVGSTAVSDETTGAKGVTNEYEIASAYQAPGNIYQLKVTSGHNTQFTSITLHFTDVKTYAVTLPSSGLSTYCCEYPLDFTNATDYKAYIVKSISGSDITLERITGKIKGGVPVILYGEGGNEISLKTCNSTNVPEGNMLVGTLAPTYVTKTSGGYTNYGMSGGKFKKLNKDGVIPAHKAYLPIEGVSEAREFNFIFNDGEVTGISSIENGKSIIENGAWYTLGGQKMNGKPSTKGIYIINGKKVVIK